MSMLRILGIDPGKTGYAVEGLYDPHSGKWTLGASFPLKECWETLSATGKPDLWALVRWMDRLLTPRIIVVEEVNARTGDGAVQAFTFGGAAMLVDMSVCTMDHERIVRHVNPATWKANLGLATGGSKSEKKARSRVTASAIYGAPFKSHDMAEAALLAYYGRRFLPA